MYGKQVDAWVKIKFMGNVWDTGGCMGNMGIDGCMGNV